MSEPPSKAPCIKKVIRVMLIKLNYFLISCIGFRVQTDKAIDAASASTSCVARYPRVHIAKELESR
jgi:hypothetical protein